MVLPAEAIVSKPSDPLVAGRTVLALTNVSNPTLTIYRPDPAKNTGAAVVVCPGGGYYILAMDLEGTEVCEWLQSLGITAALLKYRVPAGNGENKHPPGAPLQDAQRALGMLRHQAGELRLDPARIGILGFSAGGYLAAMLGSHHAQRAYAPIDAADQVSCRPDFCALIYPGGLTDDNKNDVLAPEFKGNMAAVPPTFIAMAEDDAGGVENALLYYLALKHAKIPVEMHLYPVGGHGYGLRRTSANVTSWPDRFADWMKASGWLKPAK